MGNSVSDHNLLKVQSNIEKENVYLDSYPYQVHFLMIDKCNVKCIMCGGDYFRSSSGRRITLDKFETMAAHLKLENARAIVLAGAGDPLLNQDLVAIVQFVRNTYPLISISITTNGLSLTAQLSGRLLDHGVSLVNISINSASRATYRRIMQVDGFDAVCCNARSFADQRNRSGQPVVLQFSAAINRLNIEELPLLVELGREAGVNSINLFYTRFYPERIRHLNVDDPADRLENDASLFFHQELSDEMVLKAKSLAQAYRIHLTHEPLFRANAAACPCTWPMTQVMVGFDGEIYPCGGSEVHFREKVEQGIYNFGNALQGPVDGFWNSEIYRSLRVSSRQGAECPVPECQCCANSISPNDIRSHIMQWDDPLNGRPASPAATECVITERQVASSPPLVSVIVPTYNRPDQLAGAIESILFQTYRNVEIIVVNDGGIDVEQTVSSMNRSYSITYVKHAKNLGLAAARNTGIKVARGKYIAYLDDDDLFYRHHVQTLVQALEPGEFKVAYTDAYRAHQEKKNGRYEVTKRDVPYSFDFDYERILTTNFVPVLCFMHSRSCIEETGLFDESLKRLEDWDMWIRMSRKFRFVHVKELTCEFSWRKDGTTMSSGQVEAFVESRKKIAEKYNIASPLNVSEQPFSGKEKKAIVSIVIVTFNQMRYTKGCVESIQNHTPEMHEIIFVDNGSSDGTVKWLRKLVKHNSNYKLIENKKNLGFSKGCNQGIEAATGEFILLLNNDVVVTENWLGGMLECLQHGPGIGIVGPMTNNISGPQKVPSVDYTAIDELDEYSREFRKKNRHRRIPNRRVVGFCILFRRQLIEEIGFLDESFGSGNFEDDDLCLRASLAGYRNMIAGDVFLHHYGSRTFIGNGIDYGSSLSGNRKIFIEKWNGEDVARDFGGKLIVESAVAQAEELFSKEDIEKATACMLGALKQAPQDRSLYFKIAEMLIDVKRYQDAVDILDALHPNDSDPIRPALLGYCEEALGKNERAQEFAEFALAVDPRAALPMNVMGVIAFKKGECDAAEGWFRKAIEADPGFGESCTNLGSLKWAAGDTEEAMNLFERAFRLSPTINDVAAAYHSAVVETKSFETAEAVFREAMALHPNHKRIVFLMIALLLQQGKHESALPEIEKAMIQFGIDEGILSACLEIRNKIGPMEIDRPNRKRATVSVCIIVKNEEQHLAKCLMSVKPIVDEMIVVDTGSTDQTKTIATALGAKVYDYSWKNDFSEARNYSLSKATGDWVLVLDADEVISPSDHPNLLKLTGQRPRKPVAYILTTRNYTNQAGSRGWVANEGQYGGEEAGQGWVPSPKVRLFVNHQQIRFVNPVHELVEPTLEKLGIKVKACGVPVHHYGRLDQNKLLEKGKEYFRLGIAKIEQTNGDCKALKELAIQASEIGEYGEAVRIWKRVVALQPNDAVAHMNMGFAHLMMRQYPETISTSRKAMELDPQLREAVINYSAAEMIAGDLLTAISTLETLLERNPNYPPAMGRLAAAYLVAGRKEEGLRSLDALKARGFDCAGALTEQAQSFIAENKVESAALLLESAIESGTANGRSNALLAECRTRLADGARLSNPVAFQNHLTGPTTESTTHAATV